MSIREGWADNKGVAIHFIDSYEDNDTHIPLFICPGLSESAEDYNNLQGLLAPRRCIAMSFRGRGRSDCPEQGYSLEDHAGDIEAVINHLKLKEFFLLGYSRGASYTIDYAIRNNRLIRGLIIAEYPALHKKMYDGWAEELLRTYPDTRLKYKAAIGIERESRDVDFSNLLYKLDCPTLIMRGMKDSSLLSEEAAEIYLKCISKCRIETFENAGHDIQTDDFESYIKSIKGFIDGLDQYL